MNIEIHDPELERQVQKAMKSGRFQDFEEMLARALGALSENVSAYGPDHSSGAALVEAMQASPHKEIELEPQRHRLPVREVSF